MSDSVKFIFKTLIKIPVAIMAAYLVFNAFAFGLTYFKLLGFSYVVMQTAAENNYIPAEQLITLNSYLDGISNTGVVDNVVLVLVDPVTGHDASVRTQYGAPVTVGVSAHYKFIWPLTPKDQLQNTSEDFIGYDSSPGAFSGFADEATLEQRRAEIENNTDNNINIIYTVPGLKYYPDLI